MFTKSFFYLWYTSPSFSLSVSFSLLSPFDCIDGRMHNSFLYLHECLRVPIARVFFFSFLATNFCVIAIVRRYWLDSFAYAHVCMCRISIQIVVFVFVFVKILICFADICKFRNLINTMRFLSICSRVHATMNTFACISVSIQHMLLSQKWLGFIFLIVFFFIKRKWFKI